MLDSLQNLPRGSKRERLLQCSLQQYRNGNRQNLLHAANP